MSLPNRKTLRSALKTDLGGTLTGGTIWSGGVTMLQGQVYDYYPKDPGGISPYAVIDSGTASYSLDGDEGTPTQFGIAVTFFARRDSADGADDILDDLALDLANICRSNYNARFLGPSQSDFELVAGVDYKFEVHFIEFDVVG
jgi:hypothetical protein